MKELIVEEFEVATQEELDEVSKKIPVGFKYSYFKDAATGKYYRPNSDFRVRIEHLEKFFEEVEAVEVDN